MGAWLSIHMGLPPKGLKALRCGLDGMKLLEMTTDQLQIFLDTTLDDDLSCKLQSLIETGHYGSKQINSFVEAKKKERRESSNAEITRPKSAAKEKSKTLMSKRISAKNAMAAASEESTTNKDEEAERDFELDHEIDSDDHDSIKPPPSYHSSEEARDAASFKNGKEKAQSKNGTAPILLEKWGKTVSFQTPEKLNPESRDKNISKKESAQSLSNSQPTKTPSSNKHADKLPIPLEGQEDEDEEESEILPNDAVEKARENEKPETSPRPSDSKPNRIRVEMPPERTVVYVEREPQQALTLGNAHNEYLTKVLI